MSDVDKLEAGPKLDALVAEKVMGWEVGPHTADPLVARFKFRWKLPNDAGYGDEPPPEYSTDIAAAWEVVEKLCASGDFCLLTPLGFGGNGWACKMMDDDYNATALTAPLAICRAALNVSKSKQ